MTRLSRPTAYVPLSVRFITGGTGTTLLETFGRDGPLVWAAYLAACKINRPEGEISYASDTEGWALLGLAGYEPSFTLDDFFAVTGRLKKTRRTRSGRVSHVSCTVWERWSDAQARDAARQRKARSRHESDRDNGVTPPGQDRDLETEQRSRSREVPTEQSENRDHATPEAATALPINDLLNGTHPEAALRLAGLAARGKPADAAMVLRYTEGLPEHAIARTTEALLGRKPKPTKPAGYVVNTLKALRAELGLPPVATITREPPL